MTDSDCAFRDEDDASLEPPPRDEQGRWPERRTMPDAERLEAYRALSAQLSAIFDAVEPAIRPGVTTKALEALVAGELRRRGLHSSFRGQYGYPALITTSVNDALVNGPPSDRPLSEGDLLSLQIGVMNDDAFAYQGWPYLVGRAAGTRAELVEACAEALWEAVATVRMGTSVWAVSRAIEERLTARGLAGTRDFVGHVMGAAYRAPPRIPCTLALAIPDYEASLRRGWILSLVVGAQAGRPETRVGEDGWSCVTVDGADAALASAMVVVGLEGAEVLTPPRRGTARRGQGGEG